VGTINGALENSHSVKPELKKSHSGAAISILPGAPLVLLSLMDLKRGWPTLGAFRMVGSDAGMTAELKSDLGKWEKDAMFSSCFLAATLTEG
jgi:hypothetical protein